MFTSLESAARNVTTPNAEKVPRREAPAAPRPLEAAFEKIESIESRRRQASYRAKLTACRHP